jgi:molybdate transport system substrate-binding protein
LLLLLPVLAGIGCRAVSTSAQPVWILVAASTRDAVQVIADDFTRDTGIPVQISAGDSSKLANQIINGAPADLFLSANEEWAKQVVDQGRGSVSVTLLGNSLVLIVPKGNPAGVSKPEDLLRPAVNRVAVAGPTVPAGIYGREALTHFKVWNQLEQQKKIVSGENVRVTLSYVETGEADAGLVYSTDAKITDKVTSVYTFPADSHSPIIYPLVVLTSVPNSGAERLARRLQSPEAAEVFHRFGFSQPTLTPQNVRKQ